jgi:hypothetical protein
MCPLKDERWQWDQEISVFLYKQLPVFVSFAATRELQRLLNALLRVLISRIKYRREVLSSSLVRSHSNWQWTRRPFDRR